VKEKQMSIKYAIEFRDNILRVKATGKDDNLEDVKKYGIAVLEAALSSSCSKVLCDETELEYSLGISDNFESAKFISEQAPKIGKLAIFCKIEQMEDASFWETVAVNRGLQVKVCKSPEEAEEWLR
jgi:hypothetical protein